MKGGQPATLAYTSVTASYEPADMPRSTISDCVTDSVYEDLHAFTGGVDGSHPDSPLIQAADGDFYGTVARGGIYERGVIFRMTPDGFGYTILHAFAGGTDGDSPHGGLIQGTDGNFYGTTAAGGTGCGPAGCGTIYQMTPDGQVTVLHAFTGGSDGALPEAALVQASDGNFYGTTEFGGGTGCYGGGCGTVFRMTPDGEVSVLFALTGREGGAFPVTPLIQADDGNLYGTTMGVNSESLRVNPTAFQITPDGALTVLASFPLGLPDDGRSSPSGLIQATDGNLYGTTSGFGGPVDFYGTVFRLTTDGTLTRVHTFSSVEGALPAVGLVQAIDGNLYGTTTFYGPVCCGTIFGMTLDGTVFVLHGFDVVHGNYPLAPLTQAADGSLYGTALDGGAAASGVVFRQSLEFALSASPDVVNPGDPITVVWQTPPGRSPTDWIGLYPVDAANTDYLSAQYANGASCGSLTFAAPDGAGAYEFRYLVYDSFTDVARSNTVTVKAK